MGRVHESYKKALEEAERQGIKFPNLVPKVINEQKIKGRKYDASNWYIEWEIVKDEDS